VRGAITVESNAREEILAATRYLLEEMTTANDIAMDDVASVIFTATADLDAVYPAVAARELGWTQIPLLCMQEMAVRGSLDRCVRILIHWNTSLAASDVQHTYLRGAQALRPDLVEVGK
jgi:chorismate mutase